MEHDIIALLRLFDGRVPDAQSHAWVLALASDREKWHEAHGLFNKIRRCNLEAINTKDFAREGQYCFEEVCLKSLYNETQPADPFDSDSAYWIAKAAFALARGVGVPVEAVVEIMAPKR